jgi:hypothetical protein
VKTCNFYGTPRFSKVMGKAFDGASSLSGSMACRQSRPSNQLKNRVKCLASQRVNLFGPNHCDEEDEKPEKDNESFEHENGSVEVLADLVSNYDYC